MADVTTIKKNSQPQIGLITEVHGPVVVIRCDTLPPLRQGLSAYLDHDTCYFEVHQHLDKNHVRAIVLHRSGGLYRGMPVYDTGTPLHVPVAPECLATFVKVS